MHNCSDDWPVWQDASGGIGWYGYCFRNTRSKTNSTNRNSLTMQPTWNFVSDVAYNSTRHQRRWRILHHHRMWKGIVSLLLIFDNMSGFCFTDGNETLLLTSAHLSTHWIRLDKVAGSKCTYPTLLCIIRTKMWHSDTQKIEKNTLKRFLNVSILKIDIYIRDSLYVTSRAGQGKFIWPINSQQTSLYLTRPFHVEIYYSLFAHAKRYKEFQVRAFNY